VGVQRRGFLLGLGAYLSWGFFPLYWPLMAPSGPIEILAHRVLWSLVSVVVLCTVVRNWAKVKAIATNPRKLGLIAVGAAVLALNWVAFIWGVNNGHVVETSLGYFINPLLTVLIGVVVLGERLRRAQWAALSLALVAVLVLTWDYGRLPWLALTLALTFGIYGLMKKKADVGAVEGLAVETAVIVPAAAGYLVFLHAGGGGTFATLGWGHALLLVGTGLVTIIPLLFFGGAATRIPLATLGMLQYITPIIQFILGLVVFHEAMTTTRWLGFALVWTSLLLVTAESLAHHRRVRVKAPVPV
jgi:chloramphenicol-sensitive protein RarD